MAEAQRITVRGRPHLFIIAGSINDEVTEVILVAVCPDCQKEKTLTVDMQAALAWSSGKELIQNAFPELDDNEREALLTGTCQECWDEMWAYLEDEEE